MISNHLSSIAARRPAADELSLKVAQHLAAGGKFSRVESANLNPEPPKRSTEIDPSTVLKRKPKRLNLAERKALRKMADSL